MGCFKTRSTPASFPTVTVKWAIRIGESLFTLFASLTYAYHYLMTLIK